MDFERKLEYIKFLEFLEYKKNQEIQKMLEYPDITKHIKYTGIFFVINVLCCYFLNKYKQTIINYWSKNKRESIKDVFTLINIISQCSAFISGIWFLSILCVKAGIQF